MLIQNQSLRTYQLSIGEIKPMAVIDVPEDKAKEVLEFGLGELVALDIKQPEAPKTEGDDFDKMNFDELKAYGEEHNIDIAGLNSKDKLRAKFRETLDK